MAISFKGLMDYQKEIDAEKRYQEAFGLKKDAFELQKQQYELAVETLDQKKLSDSQDFIAKLLKMSGGDITGLGTNYLGTGSSGNKSNVVTVSNKESVSRINNEFPGVATETIAKIFATPNLKKDVGNRLYNKLVELKTNFYTSERTDETTLNDDLAELVNSFVRTETDPIEIKKFLESQSIDYKLTPEMETLFKTPFVNFTFDSIVPYTKPPSFEEKQKLKSMAYANRKEEADADYKILDAFTDAVQVKDEKGTATELDKLLEQFATKRMRIVNKALESSNSTKPNELFKLYGNKDYLSGEGYSKVNLLGNKFLVRPKTPIDINLGSIKRNLIITNAAAENNLIRIGDIIRIGKFSQEDYGNFSEAPSNWSGYILIESLEGDIDYLTQEEYNRMMSM